MSVRHLATPSDVLLAKEPRRIHCRTVADCRTPNRPMRFSTRPRPCPDRARPRPPAEVNEYHRTRRHGATLTGRTGTDNMGRDVIGRSAASKSPRPGGGSLRQTSVGHAHGLHRCRHVLRLLLRVERARIPMMDAHGWTSAEVSLAFTIIVAMPAVCTLLAGKLLQYSSPRTLLLMGGVSRHQPLRWR